MNNTMIVSSSPHLQHTNTTRGIMLDVIISLVPAFIAATVFFGWIVPFVTVVATAACVFAEWCARKILKRENTISDLSAAVTGLILALNLPPTLDSVWMGALGGVIAVVVVKQLFGGLGQNFANPAMVGRIVLMVSFPTLMTTWVNPLAWISGPVDAVSSATPLAIVGSGTTEGLPSFLNMAIGMRTGCMGETSAIALLIGGIYLCIKRVIKPTIPVCFIGTVAAVTIILDLFGVKGMTPDLFGVQILSGGLFLGAIYMATDYVTSPITPWGRVIFGIGCGLVTVIIRYFAALPEGVSYAILLMNLLTPHIENLTRPKPFGEPREKKQKGGDRS
ncbi:MAG: RnfABCDGE type electron transport complex subunit D [Clostridia bacterium]|nr:RnfABCDGE type electron transport complex subunit D [Clostridia bacterium]